MKNSKKSAVLLTLICLIIWLPAVAGAAGVSILQPESISIVSGHAITVSGTVDKPPDLNFYIAVWTPQRVWWVQAPPTIDASGRWQAKVLLGDATSGNGAQYSICAFLTQTVLPQGRVGGSLPKSVAWHTIVVKRQDQPEAMVKISQPTANTAVRNPTVDVRGTVTKPKDAGLYVAVMPHSSQDWVILGQPEIIGDQWRLTINLGETRDPSGKYWVRAFLTLSELKKGDKFASGKLPGVLTADELELAREPEESPFGSWLTWLGGIMATIASGIAIKLFEGRVGTRGAPPPHG